MAVLLPYARLVDRWVYGYRYSRRLAEMIVNLMGWQDDGMRQFTGIHKHATAAEIQGAIGDEMFGRYFKFAFVRNPYDFLVSLYFYIQQSKHHRFHQTVSNLSFGDFIEWYLAQQPPRQVDFLMDAPKQQFLVDYVGRFETLQQDVSLLCRRLGLTPAVTLAHKNPSQLRKIASYQSYYDDRAIAQVADYFALDLQALHYRYDGFDDELDVRAINCS